MIAAFPAQCFQIHTFQHFRINMFTTTTTTTTGGGGGGTRWRSWLRHCATSRMVAGSIPDGVIGIFHWLRAFDRNMDLESTQPLTVISMWSISWGKGGRCVGLTTFSHSCAYCLQILRASTSCSPKRLYRDSFAFCLTNTTTATTTTISFLFASQYVLTTSHLAPFQTFFSSVTSGSLKYFNLLETHWELRPRSTSVRLPLVIQLQWTRPLRFTTEWIIVYSTCRAIKLENIRHNSYWVYTNQSALRRTHRINRWDVTKEITKNYKQMHYHSH